jgi:hypothetical protein
LMVTEKSHHPSVPDNKKEIGDGVRSLISWRGGSNHSPSAVFTVWCGCTDRWAAQQKLGWEWINLPSLSLISCFHSCNLTWVRRQMTCLSVNRLKLGGFRVFSTAFLLLLLLFEWKENDKKKLEKLRDPSLLCLCSFSSRW